MANEIKMEDSVLKAIRQISGLTSEDGSFDGDLLLYINGALGSLDQVGATIKPAVVHDDTETWDGIFLNSPSIQNLSRMYMSNYVRMNFDPPTPSTQGFIKENMIELLWRIDVEVDEYYRKEDTTDGTGSTDEFRSPGYEVGDTEG